MLVLIATMVAAGCGHSPDREIAEARARAGSWGATLEMTTDAWAAGTVPARYVENTIDAAREDLTSTVQHLESHAGPAPAAPMRAMAERLARLDDSVRRGDPGAARATAHDLASLVPPAPVPPAARPGS